MPLVKVKDNYQVTIPASLLKKFKIGLGDSLEAIDTEEGILFKKCEMDKMTDEEIKEYWEAYESEPGEVTLSEEGRKRLELAFEDYEQGKRQVFENVEDLMKDLNRPEKGTLQAVLQHAGKWSDMSDDEAEYLIQDIRESRRSSQREGEF